MIIKDIKKGIFNIKMLGVLLISIGLFYFEVIINEGFFKFKLWESNQYDIVDFFVSIFASSVYILVAGMLPGIPYAYTFYEERENGYLRYILPRQGINKYIDMKIVVTALTGAVTTFIPYVFLLIPTFIVGSDTTPIKHLEVLETMGWGSVMYIWGGWLMLLMKGMLLILFGIMWALLSLMLSMYVKNKYFAYILPYVVYEVLFYMNSTVGIANVMSPPYMIRFDQDSQYPLYLPFILFGIYITVLILVIKITFKRQVENGKC